MKNSNKQVIGLMLCAIVLSAIMPLVVADADTGTVIFEITETVDISFTASILDWGAGSVNSGEASATLDSNASTVTGGSWNATGGELVLENIGTEDVSLTLNSSVDAATFIGGTSSTFKWKISEDESGSCANMTDTSFTEVSTSSKTICDLFDATDATDEIKIDFQLVVPSDASLEGQQSATITATGTKIV